MSVTTAATLFETNYHLFFMSRESAGYN